MFELTDIAVAYGSVPALAPTSLAIGAGETLLLLGPSGSGKSTLLRTLAGLTPFTGSLRFEGATVSDWRAVRRRLGYVIQDGGLFPHLTARGNVALMARELGWPAERIAARVEELAALVALDAAQLDRFPAELSGGQRQRVLIARALVQDTQLLLLDEPFSGLDSPSAQRLEELLADLAAAGHAVLVATHDLEQARSWERVLCLNGEQIALGDPAQVLGTEVLARTYGHDLVRLPEDDGGALAVLPPHHHDH